MMSDLKICRICLRTEVKGYKFDLYQLKCYYEEVTASIVNNDDGLPQWFCYECSTILYKYHKFKEKCYIGQDMLRELLRNGPIIYEQIYKYERPKELLTLQPITHTDRIKNYSVKYNTDSISNTNILAENKKEHANKIKEENNELLNVTEENHELLNKTKENHELLNITEENHELLNKTQPKSPQQIIIANENMIQLENASLKSIKTKDLDVNLTSTQTNRILNEEYWKRTDLTEEEAIKEFRLKAESRRYLEAIYKCQDCFVFYLKKETLRRHVLMRHDESVGAHVCRICRVRFKWKSHLRKHITVHYTKYECLRCHQVFHLENSAFLHEQYHNGEKKKCPHCGKQFSHMTTYYTHLRTHRSCSVCSACGAAFVSRAGLRQHARRMHAHAAAEHTDDDDEVATFCAKCDITFDTRKAYDEHLFQSAKHTDFDSTKITHNEEADMVCSKKILGKRLQEKLRRRKSTENETTPLQKVITRRKIKRKHRIPTKCHQCGEQFSTQRACMQHHVVTHPRTSFYSQTDRHICELCGVSLAPGSVSVHRNMHTRDQLHPCQTCGKQFHSGVSLKRHILSHTGEKPFGCPSCEKRYTQSNSMKLHYRTAHLNQPYPERYNKNTHRKKKNSKSKKIVEEALPTNSNTTELSHSNVERSQHQPLVLQTVLNSPPLLDEDVHYLTLD